VRSWDLRFEAGSAGAAVYYSWFSHLLPAIVGDELGDDLLRTYRPFANNATPMFVEMMKTPASPWFDDKRTKDRVETRDDIIRRAFREGVEELGSRLGADPADWRWGKVHTAVFAHQPFGNSGIGPLMKLFNGAPVELPGEAFTVDAMSPNNQKQRYKVLFGVSQRLIVDLGDLSRSLSVNSTGQNAQIFHRHRVDQTELWSRNEYHPMLFDRAAVEKAGEERLTLTPKR
jgi:penicillin amidase